MNRTLMLGSLLAVTCAAQARAESALFVKIEDLSPQGSAAYEGADIDAVELRAPGGAAAYYAAAIVDSSKQSNANNADVEPSAALGQPVLVDWDAPYVFASNAGMLVARIDVPVEELGPDWRLTVYEVDGSLYAGSGAPEPYRVSVAEAAEGPWRTLGIGSGTARFTLGGESGQPFDDEMFETIQTALEEELDNEPMTENMRANYAAFRQRLSSVDDIAQLQAELVGLHTYFTYTEHVVNDHGESDGGRVMLARALLETAWNRYRGITGS